MPGLHLNEEPPSADTLLRLSRGSPDGLLFPKLEWLHWDLEEAGAALPFFCLFLSPHLRRITLYTGLPIYHPPSGRMAALTQFLSALPTSLESLDVGFGQEDADPVKDALSSFICRCGPFLRSLGTFVPLSDAATLHLMQLPNLSRWETDQGPPQVTLTPILQSLEHFDLNGEAALPWLRFLASGEDCAPTRERLKFLDLPNGTVIDSTFLSPVVTLRNLVKLRVNNVACKAAAGGCSFRLTDGDIEDLAAALPHLKSLRLGEPCDLNTCKTTVASLMSISVHCPDLLLLETHFNVQTIVGDIQGLLDRGLGHNKTQCRLQSILVGVIPLELDSTGLRTVTMGFSAIFPHVAHLVGYNGHWPELRLQMPGVGGDGVDAKAVVP